MPSWMMLPRRFQRRNLDYRSLALLSSEPDERDQDDDSCSAHSTLVGDGMAGNGLMADCDEKHLRPSRRERLSKLLRSMVFLLPSFLARDGKPPARLHPSAWLDGLRGVAAFLVVWHHSSLLFFSWSIHNGFLSLPVDDEPDPGAPHTRLIQWPFIRLLVAGSPQVKVFFVVSGYALSHRPLALARKGRTADWAAALSSSVFRRHLRLFAPAVPIMFATVLAGYFGLFGMDGRSDEERAASPSWNAGAAIETRPPPTFDTWHEQFWHWFHTMRAVVDPFNPDGRRGATQYDWNLWTLPMEFDSSMTLFLFLAAFAWLRYWARTSLGVGIAFFALWWGHWPQFLFLSGMLVCDLGFHLETPRPSLLPESESGGLRAAAPSAPTPPRVPRLRLTAWKDLVSLASFLAALHLLAFPELNRGGRTSPGYITLTRFIPSAYEHDAEGQWWLSIGAVLLTLTVARTPFLQRLFTTGFAQYLGRIAFALYLVHGPLIFSLGWHLGRFCTGLSGRETPGQYGAGVALTYCILWPVLIWVADLAWRLIDVKAVEAGKWAYERVLARKDGR